MTVAIALADLVAIALFILGLHFLNAPPTARLGNRLAAVGMLIALIGVLVGTLGVGWLADCDRHRRSAERSASSPRFA